MLNYQIWLMENTSTLIHFDYKHKKIVESIIDHFCGDLQKKELYLHSPHIFYFSVKSGFYIFAYNTQEEVLSISNHLYHIVNTYTNINKEDFTLYIIKIFTERYDKFVDRCSISLI